MLPIVLERSHDGVISRHLGPVEALRAHGPSLEVIPARTEILRFDGAGWRASEESYAALVIETRVLVCMHNSRRSRGPFQGPFDFIRIAHGAIQTSLDGRRTLARYSSLDQHWYLCHDQSRWRSVVFLPCARSRL